VACKHESAAAAPRTTGLVATFMQAFSAACNASKLPSADRKSADGESNL
jgi:hypothetical protein